MEKEIQSIQHKNTSDDQVKEHCKRDTSAVKRLNLGFTAISAIGVLHLCGAKWDNLIQLSLVCNYIRNRGCKYLTRTAMNKIQLLKLCTLIIMEYKVQEYATWPKDSGSTIQSHSIGIKSVVMQQSQSLKQTGSTSIVFPQTITDLQLLSLCSQSSQKRRLNKPIWVTVNFNNIELILAHMQLLLNKCDCIKLQIQLNKVKNQEQEQQLKTNFHKLSQRFEYQIQKIILKLFPYYYFY